jgi:hypothetical protein
MIWITILIAWLLLGWLPVQVETPTSNDIAQAHMVTEVSEHTSLQEAVAKALRDTGVSAGVVTVENGCSVTSHDFYLPKGIRLSDAMDSLTTKDGRHRWQVSKGVIIVLPTDGVPAVLETKISHIQISDKKNLTLAVDELLQSKEVRGTIALTKAFVRSPEPGFQKLNTAGSPTTKEPLDLTNVSLTDALNELALAQTSAVWSYSELACNGRRMLKLEFLTK